MFVKVFGTLFFNNGQKLNFDCNSLVSVTSSGLLDGGNPGSKIDMCGTTVWRGPGPTPGPLLYGYNPLPINLLSFTAEVCKQNVCLSWITNTEANNDYFTIEKTKDNRIYELVDTLKGAGNSTTIRKYTLADTEPYPGISYYRLKQTDFNGAFKYFSLKEVNRISDTDFSLNAFPNPGNSGDEIKLKINAEQGEEILVVVFDAMGREAFSKIVVTERKGENVTALDPSGKLEPGIYFVTGTSDKNVDSKKLIIK